MADASVKKAPLSDRNFDFIPKFLGSHSRENFITLSEWIAQNNLESDSNLLLQMDIEGGEEVVIPAAIDVLRNTRFLIVEIHNDRIDSKPIISVLNSIYTYSWQLNDRESNKPLFIMTNEYIDFGGWATK